MLYIVALKQKKTCFKLSLKSDWDITWANCSVFSCFAISFKGAEQADDEVDKFV